MADAIWPISLPQAPRVSDFSEVTPVLALRTEMDVGPAKVRNFRVALDMTGAQVATFDTFFVDTCLGGATAFQWKQHRTGNQIDYRFTGQPEYTPRGPRLAGGAEYWRVTFDLESLPGTEVIGTPPPPPANDGTLLRIGASPEDMMLQDEVDLDFYAPSDLTIFAAAPNPFSPLVYQDPRDDTTGFEEDQPMDDHGVTAPLGFGTSSPPYTSTGPSSDGGSSDGGA